MRFALLTILLLPCALALTPSEILPNPLGDDNGKEFIELVGSEDLTGCIVRDTSSADTLQFVKAGNEVILIVEEDGIYNDTPDATIYHAGKAIGNALGNTADAISIACNGTTLLNVTYDLTGITGYAEGYSLVWEDAWILGVQGGTPGTIADEEEPEEPSVNDTRPGQSENRSQKNAHDACNATLDVHVSALEGYAGDTFTFAIISNSFASFEVSAQNETIITGDTMTTHAYTITLPDAHELRIRASATQCDARQRATRIVRITQRPAPEPLESHTLNESVNVTTSIAPALEETEPTAPVMLETDETPEIITASVVYESEPNMIPWISAFGICVLGVSAWLWHRTKEEDGAKDF